MSNDVFTVINPATEQPVTRRVELRGQAGRAALIRMGATKRIPPTATVTL